MILSKALGPAALILAGISMIHPVVMWGALVLACIAALRGYRAFSIAAVAVSGALFIGQVVSFVQAVDNAPVPVDEIDGAMEVIFMLAVNWILLLAAACILLYQKTHERG